MTTNVTHRRPHRMPWEHRELLFDPAELRRLFPERIVAWLEEHPPPLGDGREAEPAGDGSTRFFRSGRSPRRTTCRSSSPRA